MAKKQTLPRPLFDRILVKCLPQETITPGGIVLPDGTPEKTLTGEVVAVGPGRTVENDPYERHSMSVGIGDIILYSNLDGVELERAGQKYIVLSERDVVAVER